jgi:hypothetical protein
MTSHPRPASNRSRSLTALAWLLTCVVPFASWSAETARLETLFRNPPVEYSTGPLWVWNDLLTEQEIRDTLRDLAGQKVQQVWVHPRPGLMTPYLSSDWFQLWRVALREAKRLHMKVWIYDENSYPSGFAGGFVPEAMPESRGRGLVFKESKAAPEPATNRVAIYQLKGDRWERVDGESLSAQAGLAGPFLSALEVRAGNSPWHGDRCYVNLLSPGVTEKFLELTLEPYRLKLGTEFGRRIPGVFTDEPNIRPAGDFPWSEVLAPAFKKRWGYDLLEHLPSLVRPTGDWRKIRHNYFQVLHEQFVEHWARPYHDYCETNRLEWTGHYWDHEWPNCVGVPDNMAMYAWHQRPAIDCLMNQYSENTHGQFGNLRMPKELSSVANQLGLERTLCEVYGAGGWDLRFEDMKRIGDWLEVLGVNTLNQHLSYVTIRGARKRDHPQSFSYHEPWWQAYHISARYFARISAVLSQGAQVNPVLVLEPTTTAWMYQGDNARLQELGTSFFDLLKSLEAEQIEYDIGCEDIIARYGTVTNGLLRVGKRSYHQVVLPPMVENLNRETKSLLERVTCVPTGARPPRVDGMELAGKSGSEAIHQDWQPRLLALLQQQQKQAGLWIERRPSDAGILFHHRRSLGGGEVLFLVNTSAEQPSAGKVHSRLPGVEKMDPYSGEILPYASQPEGEGLTADFELPPSGSLLLLLTTRPLKTPLPPALSVRTVAPSGIPAARRLEPNVLTIDYLDVTAGGKTRTNCYCYQANQFAWKQNGLPRNPWDSAVQFEDEFIRKTFPADSGVEASYRFTITDSVPANLEIVIERADLYSITCNGRPVQAQTKGWWLDKAFGRVPLAATAQRGENVVTLKTSPFTMFCELEPAYVRGDFSLEGTEHGFVITADRGIAFPMGQSSGQAIPQKARTNGGAGWAEQGHPFYGGSVSYAEEFTLGARAGKYLVVLPHWRGSVAEIRVNGKQACYIDAPPWEGDVSKWLRTGQNRLEVVVVGTLKNTLGPHHGSPALGAAWPGGFHQGPEFGPPPGTQYDLVNYGLFEPFRLKQVLEEPSADQAAK